MLLSFLIIWIGLLIGGLAYVFPSAYTSILVVEYIFYSLGIILHFFTILGLVLTDNSIVNSVKIALVIFALIIFIAALIYPPLTSLIPKILP